MNQQFIRQITIDWNKIDKYSYLRDIKAISGLDEPGNSRSRYTFFVGENGSGKSTLLEAVAVALRL